MFRVAACEAVKVWTQEFWFCSEVVDGSGPMAKTGDTLEFNFVCRRSNGYFVYRWWDATCWMLLSYVVFSFNHHLSQSPVCRLDDLIGLSVPEGTPSPLSLSLSLSALRFVGSVASETLPCNPYGASRVCKGQTAVSCRLSCFKVLPGNLKDWPHFCGFFMSHLVFTIWTWGFGKLQYSWSVQRPEPACCLAPRCRKGILKCLYTYCCVWRWMYLIDNLTSQGTLSSYYVCLWEFPSGLHSLQTYALFHNQALIVKVLSRRALTIHSSFLST